MVGGHTVEHIRLLVFGELDDALTHGPPRAASETAALFRALEADGIVVVLCSWRTRAELELVQQDLTLVHPFVAEGGSAAFVPHGYFPLPAPWTREVAGFHAIEFGQPSDAITRIIRGAAARLHIEVVTFSELSVQQVADGRRLSLLQARLAKLRDYSVCFRIEPDTESTRERLFRNLQAANLHCLRGDRFHIASASRGFDDAISALRDLYQASRPSLATPRARAVLRSSGTDLEGWIQTIARLAREDSGSAP